MPDLIEDASIELPGSFRLLIDRLVEHLNLLHRQVEEVEVQIKAGIGPATRADGWRRFPVSGR